MTHFSMEHQISSRSNHNTSIKQPPALTINKASRLISKPHPHRQHHHVQRPMVRIIHVVPPKVIETDVANFRELVQSLTGKQSTDCPPLHPKEEKVTKTEPRTDHQPKKLPAARVTAQVDPSMIGANLSTVDHSKLVISNPPEPNTHHQPHHHYGHFLDQNQDYFQHMRADIMWKAETSKGFLDDFEGVESCFQIPDQNVVGDHYYSLVPTLMQDGSAGHHLNLSGFGESQNHFVYRG